MSGKSINFDDKKIKKSVFYKNKKAFQLVDNDANKILVSKKEPYGMKTLFKYFIGYNDNDVIRPLCLRLSQINGYTKELEEIKKKKTISLRVKDKQLLKNYNKIWKRIESLMSVDFESNSVYGYDDRYIKTKIKIYVGSLIINFHKKKILKENVPCRCLSIIMLDSVIR